MDLSNLFEIDNMRFQFIIGTTVSFYLIGGFGNILSMVIFNNKLFSCHFHLDKNEKL